MATAMSEITDRKQLMKIHALAHLCLATKNGQ